MGNAKRWLHAALMATPGVESTTWVNVPLDVETLNWEPGREREENLVETGTPVKGTGQSQGGNLDTLTWRMDGDYDLLPLFNAPIINSPVSAAHATATGVRVHQQKEGYNRPHMAFRWYDGVIVRQMLDCVGTQVDLEQANKGKLKVSYTYVGPAATSLPVISVAGGKGAVLRARVTGGIITSVEIIKGGTGYPSTPAATVGGPGSGVVLAVTTTLGVITGVAVTSGGTGYEPNVAQVQHKPIEWPHFRTKINGADFVDVKSYKLTIKNDTEARYTGIQSADPQGFDEGNTEVSGDILANYRSDTASLLLQWEANAEPGPIEFIYENIWEKIGSAAPTTRSLNIKVNRPVMPKVGDDMKPKSAQNPITFKGHLDYAAGAALLVTTVNLTADYVGS